MLFLVSVPIGNNGDITHRALEILRNVDFIICEEFKNARSLLSLHGIIKEIIPLNEHNEKIASNEILSLLMAEKTAALISDCGTPLFYDPGNLLVRLCIENNIRIIPVPGANSLLPALIASGFNTDRFYFYGMLSQKSEIRRKELLKLKNMHEVIVLLDTPYRLRTLIKNVCQYIGRNIPAVLAFQITMENEYFYRGTAGELSEIAEKNELKGEFVLILNNKY